MANKMYIRHVKEILNKYGPLSATEIILALHNESSRTDQKGDTRRRKYVPTDGQVIGLLRKKEFHIVSYNSKNAVYGLVGVHEVMEDEDENEM